jgi:hypothetical protein
LWLLIVLLIWLILSKQLNNNQNHSKDCYEMGSSMKTNLVDLMTRWPLSMRSRTSLAKR